MRHFRIIRLLAVWSWSLLLAGNANANSVVVKSPDERNSIELKFANSALTYAVQRDGQTLIGPSAIRPLCADPALHEGLRLVSVAHNSIEKQFTLPWGKANTVVDHCSSATVTLQTTNGTTWTIELRAYNDGIAFRYSIANKSLDEPIELSEESTEFAVQGKPRVLFNTLDNFTSSHEALYDFQPLADLPTERLMDCPLLLVWPSGTAAAITEARVRQFAGIYLERPTSQTTTLRTRLSPLPERPEVSVSSSASVTSPWRVVLLGDSAGKLLESNLLLCLNDAPQGDFSWLQVGKTTFPWWNGDFEHDYQLPTDDPTFLRRNQQYIDFCAANGIAFHAVHGDGRPWYVQTGGDYGNATADSDVLTPRPEIHLPAIVDYARQRGVGVRLWVHWKPLSAHLEEAFTKYESWGIKGLMVDFLDRDDQTMNDFSERLLQSAARHKLHIQFHGSPKNSGEQRTFPNVLNREGVLNLEYIKWSDQCTPDHSVNVAYTRALAGPLDFHLGGFRAAARTNFQVQYLRPQVLGTRCHHLALYVVYENPMPMVADYPGAYDGQTGFDFLREVPTTWDETRFVAGQPGEYVVLARRSGKSWYLGGITNWTARRVQLQLDFLDDGSYNAALYTDGSPDGSQPNEVRVSRQQVAKSQQLTVQLSSGGGFVGVLSPSAE